MKELHRARRVGTCAIAFACGDTKVVALALDISTLITETANELRAHISEVTGLPVEAVYIAATHTHTGPYIFHDSEDLLIQEYFQTVMKM